MKGMFLRAVRAGVATIGVIVAAPVFATTTAAPSAPEKRSESSQSVQPQVEKKTADAARRSILW
jgi:hypothetical protein